MRCPPANEFRSWEQLSGHGHTRTCTGHSAVCGFIQTLSPSPPQSVSEDAGPHGLSMDRFGFIICKSLPYRHGSFLLNRLTLFHDNQYGHLPSYVRSWPSIELRGCTDFFGMITQGWVDLDEFDPLTFCRASLYNTWSLWAPLGV